MERRRSTTRIELAVTANRVRRRQGLDFDTRASQLLDSFGIWTHLPVRAGTHDQMLRKLFADVLQVVQNKSVSLGAPPVGDDPLGHHDHVPGLLFAVDDDAAEAV